MPAKILKILAAFFIVTVSLNAETILSGAISDMTLLQSGNPYIIADNITVQEGKTLRIQEGCLFLFKPFSGIIVEGSIVVEGMLENPVVFTTENDSKYNVNSKQLPNPFDWNGILIGAKAQTVKLSNFILEYSVYGIKSLKEEFVINNGTFSRNGQFHVTVKDEIKPVIEDIPFNLGASENNNNNPKNGSDLSGRKRKPVPKWVKPVGLVCTISGSVAVAGGIVFFVKMSQVNSEYNSLLNVSLPLIDSLRELVIMQNEEKKDALDEDYRFAKKLALAFSIPGSAVLATGVTMLIVNKVSKDRSKVAFIPILGQSNGICMVGEIPVLK